LLKFSKAGQIFSKYCTRLSAVYTKFLTPNIALAILIDFFHSAWLFSHKTYRRRTIFLIFYCSIEKLRCVRPEKHSPSTLCLNLLLNTNDSDAHDNSLIDNEDKWLALSWLQLLKSIVHRNRYSSQPQFQANLVTESEQAA
jgi:hypothetical protein